MNQNMNGAPRLKPWGPKIPSSAKASEGYPPNYIGATSAEADSDIHPRVNPWFSAKADKKNSATVSLGELQKKVARFRDERNWKEKNIAD